MLPPTGGAPEATSAKHDAVPRKRQRVHWLRKRGQRQQGCCLCCGCRIACEERRDCVSTKHQEASEYNAKSDCKLQHPVDDPCGSCGLIGQALANQRLCRNRKRIHKQA